MQQPTSSNIVAVDFETYYDSSYGLKTMSTWNYIYDEKFDAYLVAFHGEGVKFVGHPSKADWHLLHGKVVVMHNASFDELVMRRLVEQGVIPSDVVPERFICTADLAAYLGCKRDLKTAAKELLGIEADKAVRAQMMGKTYNDAVLAGMEDELLAYGGHDAELCYELAVKFIDQWPLNDQLFSEINRNAGMRGVMIDKDLVDKGINLLKTRLQEAEDGMPWVEEEGAKPTSPKAIRAQGRKVGIPVPASLAKDSPEVLEWIEQYSEEYPWVKSVGEYRSINGILKRVESIRNGIRADGTMPYQMKYFGAGTGRMAAGNDESGGKFNMLNMPRHAMFDVDIRPMFIARPGYKLVISDYAQIEPRLLLWKVGDTEFVDLIKKEGNIYIAYARRKWDRIILPKTTDYQLVKAQVLSLNYYCGPDRFMNTANKPPYNLGLTLDKAKEIVYQYRDDNPLIKGHWDEHQKWLMFSANHSDKSHEVELPSGRVLKYFNPYWEKLVNKKTGKESWEITAQGEMGGHRTRLHSGVLTNNEIQGAAYDILSDAGVALYKEGYKVLWSVYDEFIMEVPEDKVEGSIPIIEDIMCNSSPWAKGCPLAVETNVSDFYYKA